LWIVYVVWAAALRGETPKCGAGLYRVRSFGSKSKNHTAHNQNRKAHRNGLKRPTTQRYMSTKGVDAKFMKNLRYAKSGTRRKAIAEGILTADGKKVKGKK